MSVRKVVCTHVCVYVCALCTCTHVRICKPEPCVCLYLSVPVCDMSVYAYSCTCRIVYKHISVCLYKDILICESTTVSVCTCVCVCFRKYEGVACMNVHTSIV